MLCFSLAVTEWQMSIRMAEARPYYFFGRGTSVARRDQRVMSGLLSELIWCIKPEIGDEDSASLKTYLDASRMYDWN